MKWTDLWISTLKETPKEAVVKSHVLMLRAGLIFKQSSGIYGYTPLGFRVFQKVYHLIQEEIVRIGGEQVALPHIVPRSLWEKTGRYQKMGKNIFTFQDRNEQDFLLGPTHEESMVEMLKGRVTSHRQFPVNLFQIEKKFRDEIRPRYGVMRGREFTMMDGYSFHLSLEDLDRAYQFYRLAYRRIFIRMGLTTLAVQADSGDMGGSGSEEFMVPNDIGDDTVFSCDHCSYVANRELATFSSVPLEEFSLLPEGVVPTPDIKNIPALAQFLRIPESQTVKTVVFRTATEQWIIAMIRGDREINEVKLSRLVGQEIHYEENPQKVQEEVGPIGFLGPKDFVPKNHWVVVVDPLLMDHQPRVVAMNVPDVHYQGFVFPQDFPATFISDVTKVKEGDSCPVCKKGHVRSFSGIEVGHIFKLGDYYSQSMGFSVFNEQSTSIYPLMGCYGIGVDRSLAAVIEQEGTEEELILPSSISPFQVLVISIGKENASQAEQLTKEFEENWETLWDNRDVSAGIKFKDSDLLGVPIRVTLGKRFREEGLYGIKHRKFSESEDFVSKTELFGKIQEYLKKEEKQRQKLLDELPEVL